MKLTRRVLDRIARPVDFVYPWKNERLAKNLLEFMIAHNGIGLAAPQVGIGQRVFVMKIGVRSWACFNPEIMESSDDFANFDEGCLSFPGDQCTISRPNTIKVRYRTAPGDIVQEELLGLASRCFQHELDHLDGITMHDRKAYHAV
jgi:peptide deformylase